MSTEEAPGDAVMPMEETQAQQPPTEPAAMAAANKKRPRLDLDALSGGRERKRGKSMFGLLVGTLNKAKIEDKERNASEAAKKRQLIEQRLQNKLRKETDSVRRAEEAKKDKTAASRKEMELQLKDSIYKYRHSRLPLFSNFLLTSDNIPASLSDDSPLPPSSANPLSHPPRSHPPPLYYLPTILLPSQEAFLTRRKAEVAEAAEKEWSLFLEERTAGITEINSLRQRVADEEAARKKASQDNNDNNEDMEMDNDTTSTPAANAPPPASTEDAEEKNATASGEEPAADSAKMDVDKEPSEEKKDPEVVDNDDDAVEY